MPAIETDLKDNKLHSKHFVRSEDDSRGVNEVRNVHWILETTDQSSRYLETDKKIISRILDSVY